MEESNFFTVRRANHWDNLPRDTVGSPSLEVFRTWLDRVLDNLIQAPFPMEGGTNELSRSLPAWLFYSSIVGYFYLFFF